MRRVLVALVLLGVGLSVGQPYGHVVITARSHASQYETLGDYVEGVLGLNDTVVAVEDLVTSYPGRDTPEKLRNFIRYAYSDWGTISILLGGDVDVIPCRYAYAYRNQVEYIPCDLYYSALDGDWDANGNGVFGEVDDAVDLYPDVFVGRVPASSPGTASLFVSKFLTYVTDSTAPYLDKVFLNGFDLYHSPVIYGEIACEFYEATLVPENMKPCIRVYDSHSGNHRTATLQRLNEGQHIWVHADHCGWWVMGTGWENHGTYIDTADLYGLSNGTARSILLSVGCSTGAFDEDDCCSEVFVSAQNGGGVAALTNSRAGLLMGPDYHHMASFLQMEENLFAFFMGGNSSLLELARVQGVIAPLADTSPTYRWCHYQYYLLGEPLMPVWIPISSGVAEGTTGGGTRARYRMPSVLFGPELARLDVRVLDAAGRDLTDRRGDLSPGVYFVRATGTNVREAGRKVLIAR